MTRHDGRLPRRTREQIGGSALGILLGLGLSAFGVAVIVSDGSLTGGIGLVVFAGLIGLSDVDDLWRHSCHVAPGHVRVGPGKNGVIERAELVGVGIAWYEYPAESWFVMLYRRSGSPVQIKAYRYSRRAPALRLADRLAAELGLPVMDPPPIDAGTPTG